MWRIFKKWFIPHEENDYRPHVLRPRTIFTVCAFAIVVELVFLSWFSMPALRSPFLGDIVVSTLTDGTNAARVADDLPTLQVNSLLMQVAQQKVNDMVANNYFAHTSPAGLSPWYWFEQVGYNFTYAGENLAVDFSDSQDVTNAWLNSPEHRANILSANFTQIGIAIATGTYEGHPAVFVAEEFGTPSPVAAAIPASGSGMAVPVVSAPKPAPTTIAVSGSQTSSSEQTFVAVKGVSINANAVATATPAVGSVSAVAQVPVPSSPSAPSSPPATDTNAVQRAVANPRDSVDSMYLFVAIFFALAFAVNIFVKIRTQHPNIIMGGLVAISLAGIFIILNQHLFLSAVIK